MVGAGLSEPSSMNASFWTNVLLLAREQTTRIGTQLMQDFAQVQARTKSDGSLVTRSDEWADRELRGAISNRFPDHGLLTEEGDRTFPGTDWCWAIDPIDGTNNFARGIPVWGTSMALMYRGTPVFGYLNIPPLQQAFYGYYQAKPLLATLPANSAYMNERPIRPSSDSISRHHFFSVCSRSWAAVTQLPCKRRMLGAAAYNLSSVALGSTLGALEATPKIWDIAAAWVIVHGAGAAWLPLDGKTLFPLRPGQDYVSTNYPTLVASRPELVPEFKDAIIPAKL